MAVVGEMRIAKTNVVTPTLVPPEFICPLSREVMRDPVTAADGYSYERTEIENWLASGNTRSPVTGDPLDNLLICPNTSLKVLIGEHKQKKSRRFPADEPQQGNSAFQAALKQLEDVKSECNKKRAEIREQEKIYGAITSRIETVSQSAGIDPGVDVTDAESLVSRGADLLRKEKYDESLRHFELALLLNPEDPPTLSCVGTALYNLKRYEDAKKFYARSLIISPLCPATLSDMGVLLKELGDHRNALFFFEQALLLEPNNSDVLNNKGVVLQSDGKYDEALQAYDLAIRHRPACAAAWRNRGDVLRATGRMQECIAAYAESLRIRPNHAKTLAAHEAAVQEMLKGESKRKY